MLVSTVLNLIFIPVLYVLTRSVFRGETRAPINMPEFPAE
jgi:hypothetical protein